MRTFLTQSLAAQSDGLKTRLPAVPHMLAALAIWPAFGASACATGLLLSSLVSFVVWLPLTAITLNKGQGIPEGVEPPAFTGRAKFTLFLLWTLTAWAFAAAVA
jgi:hypothetical protein